MVILILLGVVVLDADSEDGTELLLPRSCYYSMNQSSITPLRYDNNTRASRRVPGIRKRRTTYVKAVLANPKLTETQILARKFANEALRSTKVQDTIKTLTSVKSNSQNMFGPASRSLSVRGKIAGRKSNKQKLRVRKNKTKQKRKNHGKIRWTKSHADHSRHKVGRSTKEKNQVISIRHKSQGKRKNVEDNSIVKRRIRDIGDPFEGESMIERLMRTTTRDPTKKNPGDQGIEYSEYYNDNDDPADLLIYNVRPEFNDALKDRPSRASQRVVNNDILYDEDEPVRETRQQKLYFDENLHNRRSVYDENRLNNFDNLQTIPKGTQSIPENTNQYSLPEINEDYYSNVLQNDAPIPNKDKLSFGTPYSYRIHNHRNPIADRFEFPEGVRNHISNSDFNQQKESLPAEGIRDFNQQAFGTTLNENLENTVVFRPKHAQNLQIGGDYGHGLNNPGFPFQTVSGGSAEHIWNFDHSQNDNYANLKDQKTTKSSSADEDQTIESEKFAKTTCVTNEEKLQTQSPAKLKAKAMKSTTEVNEEQKLMKSSANETKEVANEILNRIIDELEDLKMDRAKKKHTEGLPCKLSGIWSSTQAGIKIDIKLTNRTINATFQKSLRQPVHRDFLNSTWNVSGSAPFRRGAPFSLIAINNTTKSMAVFIGTCRICQGIDTIQGVWSVAREPKDCRDYQMSTSVFNDIFRKTNVSSITDDNRFTRNDSDNVGKLTTITSTENSTRKDK